MVSEGDGIGAVAYKPLTEWYYQGADIELFAFEQQSGQSWRTMLLLKPFDSDLSSGFSECCFGKAQIAKAEAPPKPKTK
jgi:hypothetical protein